MQFIALLSILSEENGPQENPKEITMQIIQKAEIMCLLLNYVCQYFGKIYIELKK